MTAGSLAIRKTSLIRLGMEMYTTPKAAPFQTVNLREGRGRGEACWIKNVSVVQYADKAVIGCIFQRIRRFHWGCIKLHGEGCAFRMAYSPLHRCSWVFMRFLLQVFNNVRRKLHNAYQSRGSFTITQQSGLKDRWARSANRVKEELRCLCSCMLPILPDSTLKLSGSPV